MRWIKAGKDAKIYVNISWIDEYKFYVYLASTI